MMKNIYRILLSIAASLLCVTACSQERIKVSGTVVDENGEPLIAAGVSQSGTDNGTVTDIDGKYVLTVPANAKLTFTYISYTTQEVLVAGRSVIDMQLLPDNTLLEEVVVIGYGTVKKSDLTGSVSSISDKSLKDFKASSVVEALGGQIAGVNITASDGTPGAGYDIKIRGVGTVNGDSSPLFIVDGFEVSNIDFLASQDIQSIDFLKDASAAAIYGARAANGVVLVTTKSGREGMPQISYNGSASYRKLSRKLETISPYDFVALQLEVNQSNYAETYFKPGNDSDGP